MAKLRILSARGDTVLEWDPGLAASGEREAQAAVREAERIFEQSRTRGATAFRVAISYLPGTQADTVPTIEHFYDPITGRDRYRAS